MGGKFFSRAFVSLILVLSGVLLLLSSVILYLSPKGRIAYWIDWRLLFLTKENWTDVHILLGLLFWLALMWHIYLNWKPLKSYLLSKVNNLLSYRLELSLALTLTLIFFLSAMYRVPPLSYVLKASDYFKEAWIGDKGLEPPFSHAEEVSLRVFCKRLNIDLEKALEELTRNGIKIDSPDEKLKSIASKNKTNPAKIYYLIKKLEKNERTKAEVGLRKREKKTFTPQEVEEKFAGTGIGRKTVKQICEEVGIKIEEVKARLEKKGIKAKDDETLKEVATRYQTKPLEVLKMMLTE